MRVGLCLSVSDTHVSPPRSHAHLATRCVLCASAGLDDHVGNVRFDDAVLGVEVDHGEWPPLGGDAARRHGRVDAVDFELAEHGGVEGRGDAGGAGQVLGALAHAVVHVVALGRNDPVVPLDVLELDVEVFLAAHADVLGAAQRALPERVFAEGVAEAHLGHQEGLVGGASGAVQRAQVLAALVADHLQVQLPPAAVQKGLQGPRDGEGVPVALVDLQHLLHHQSAVGVRASTLRREEDLRGEAGVRARVLRGARVDPQI